MIDKLHSSAWLCSALVILEQELLWISTYTPTTTNTILMEPGRNNILVNRPPPYHPYIFTHFPFRSRTSSSFVLFQLLTPELFTVLNWTVPHRARAARAL